MFFSKIENLPRLELGYREGNTDYIDFIKWDEVTEPAMLGIDKFRRKFVVMKFIINKNGKKPIKVMQTFFQRYTNGTKWMGCGHATQYLFYTVGGIKEEQFDFLDKILDGNELEIPDNINTRFNSGSKIELYDEKKEASIVIQRNWRLCRYNPKYKMCEKVQSRNFDLINEEPK